MISKGRTGSAHLGRPKPQEALQLRIRLIRQLRPEWWPNFSWT